MSIEIPKDKWPGAVQTVTLGATAEQGGTRAKVVTVGGEQTLPFMHFENEIPHRPVIALEMTACRPGEWSQVLQDAWGDALDDPAQWAQACEKAGADLILLMFGLIHAAV